MAHDKFYGGFIDVIVFPPVGKMGEAGQRLINSCHFKGREIKHIIMASDKLVSRRPQGGFGVAAGADHIPVPAKGGPQVNRRNRDHQFARRIVPGHDGMDPFQVFKIFSVTAYSDSCLRLH